MSDPATEYYVTLLRRYAWPALTKRQKKRLIRIDPLLWASIRGIAEFPTIHADTPE
jgi:hypothetical protein